MAKLTRQEQKVFADNVKDPVNQEISVYGSHKAGNSQYAATPNQIQSLANWMDGLRGATTDTVKPPLEDTNAIFFVLTHNVGYVLQQGIPEYSALTEYHENSFCSDSGNIYVSRTNTNVGNAVTSATHWREFSSGSGGTGTNGWSPQLSLEAYSTGFVVEILDWVLGSGTKPGIGYITDTGSVSLNIVDARIIPIPGGSGGGNDGDDGDNGWSPLVSFETYLTGMVARVNSWVLGTGTPPTTGYIGPGGVIVPTPMDAQFITIPGSSGSGEDLRATAIEYTVADSKLAVTVANADSNPSVERKLEVTLDDTIVSASALVHNTSGRASITIGKRTPATSPNLVFNLPRLNDYPLESGTITGSGILLFSPDGLNPQRRLELTKLLEYINGALSNIAESQLDAALQTKLGGIATAQAAADAAQTSANSAQTTATAASDAVAQQQVSWHTQDLSFVDFSPAGEQTLSDADKTLLRSRLGAAATGSGGTGYDPSTFTEETTAELTDEVVGLRGNVNIRIGLDNLMALIGGGGGDGGGSGGFSLSGLQNIDNLDDTDEFGFRRTTLPDGNNVVSANLDFPAEANIISLAGQVILATVGDQQYYYVATRSDVWVYSRSEDGTFTRQPQLEPNISASFIFERGEYIFAAVLAGSFRVFNKADGSAATSHPF